MLKIAKNCTWLSEVEDAANRMAANLLVSIETGLFDIRSLLASSCWVILITFWLNWALLSTGSTAGIPMRFSKSQRRADLIFMSIGVSQFRDGLRLTSKSQGFKSESIKISKPEIKENCCHFLYVSQYFLSPNKIFLCELGTQHMHLLFSGNHHFFSISCHHQTY